jgi:hypothetical protein
MESNSPPKGLDTFNKRAARPSKSQKNIPAATKMPAHKISLLKA